MSEAESATWTLSEDSEGYTILTPHQEVATRQRYDSGTLTFGLADDLTLRVSGAPESRDRPVQLEFRYEHDLDDRQSPEHTMIGEQVGTAELTSDTARQRLVDTVCSVYPGGGDTEEIAGLITERLDDLAAEAVAGSLFVADDGTAAMLDDTVNAEYRPEEQDWKIEFERGGREDSTTFSADLWANDDPGGVIGADTPIMTYPFRDHPERWRVCRSFWQRMAATE